MLSSFITLLQILKIHTFLEYITYSSIYTNSQATRICENNGTQANIFFALKVYLKQAPYRLLLIFFSCGILVFGYLTQLYEYTVINSGLHNLNNALYQILVTVCTIGYGADPVPPISILGRSICIITCIWGITVYTMFIMSLQTNTYFQE